MFIWVIWKDVVSSIEQILGLGEVIFAEEGVGEGRGVLNPIFDFILVL